MSNAPGQGLCLGLFLFFLLFPSAVAIASTGTPFYLTLQLTHHFLEEVLTDAASTQRWRVYWEDGAHLPAAGYSHRRNWFVGVRYGNIGEFETEGRGRSGWVSANERLVQMTPALHRT